MVTAKFIASYVQDAHVVVHVEIEGDGRIGNTGEVEACNREYRIALPLNDIAGIDDDEIHARIVEHVLNARRDAGILTSVSPAVATTFDIPDE